jgi:hypothetical protein
MLTIHIERTVDNRDPYLRIAQLEAENWALRAYIELLEEVVSVAGRDAVTRATEQLTSRYEEMPR